MYILCILKLRRVIKGGFIIMKDVQNIKGDYKFNINRVGVNNLVHPVTIKTRNGDLISTVGKFAMGVSLDRNLKGINMSRLPILLSELSENKWVFDDLEDILKVMRDRLESSNAFLDVEFDYFLEKEAPVSGFKGYLPYRCKMKTELISNNNEDVFDSILTVEVPITTLCPCSKEISEFSAHNQRGYVEVAVRYTKVIWIEEIVEMVESIGSCELYPILKRVDEKHVTEKAYENPRFAEDIVRMVSEKLYDDERVRWFRVNTRHQESIHAHDAFATIEITKE